MIERDYTYTYLHIRKWWNAKNKLVEPNLEISGQTNRLRNCWQLKLTNHGCVHYCKFVNIHLAAVYSFHIIRESSIIRYVIHIAVCCRKTTFYIVNINHRISPLMHTDDFGGVITFTRIRSPRVPRERR